MPPKLKRRRKPNLGHKPQRAPQAIGPPNLTGFADLPPELLLEIVDHLPRFPVPCNYLESPLKSEIPTRQATLLILIQLCRSFRQTLIPYVWEEIVLCSVRAGQMHPVDYRWRAHTCRVKQKGYCDSCEKPLAYDIMAQLATVRFRDPEYATRVQTLSIFIPRYSWKTILPEFAECLSILPNLKTLQLHFTHYWYAPLFGQATQKVFFKYQYTSIQTVVVPGVPGSMALIAVCPNLCHLHFTSPGDFWQPSPSIEKITGVLVDHFYDCMIYSSQSLFMECSDASYQACPEYYQT
ncbi:hypothetical protein BDN72DRAFT_892429 [Pluteus cervinus]|uniref:Uncharacterized protein n=1 Tax=Pluteus cervinus TaxID=181527 RepID=A0ACD3BAM2_9AGAR|nr:hypothetical protein BDN72DRAFT_892429 [Pluteus cervinus]